MTDINFNTFLSGFLLGATIALIIYQNYLDNNKK